MDALGDKAHGGFGCGGSGRSGFGFGGFGFGGGNRWATLRRAAASQTATACGNAGEDTR